MVITDISSFSTLWNYTTLKLIAVVLFAAICFSTLWNYTTLKPCKGCYRFDFVSVPYEITLLSNKKYNFLVRKLFQYLMKLHYSQTTCDINDYTSEFQYLMKLHYSQTNPKKKTSKSWFQYLMKLHYSQTSSKRLSTPALFQYLMKLHYSQTPILTKWDRT